MVRWYVNHACYNSFDLKNGVLVTSVVPSSPLIISWLIQLNGMLLFCRAHFQTKVLREDSSRRMYVHNATQLEVRNADEALEAFKHGQKRRRVAQTTLNAESSRSHSVFTIRLVQVFLLLSRYLLLYLGVDEGKIGLGTWLPSYHCWSLKGH
jgi:hypothetical protein